MSDSVSKVPKPQLRGLLHTQIKKNLIAAIVIGLTAGAAQKFLYNDGRVQIYADFYKNYDINKAFNTIRNKGLFDSCQPDR